MRATALSDTQTGNCPLPPKSPAGLTHSSEKKAFQGHTGEAELEESHASSIYRISAATINRIR